MFSSTGQSFCLTCHSFLSAYVQGNLTNGVNYPLAPNLTSLELSAESGCHFCQIVRQYCLYDLGDQLLSENKHQISLKTLPGDHITYNTGNGYNSEPWPPWIFGYGVTRNIQFFLGNNQSLVPHLRRQRLECPEPIHHLLSTEDDHQNTYCSEQGIRAIVALTKKWLSTCREGHATCPYYSTNGGRDQQRTVPTRLIDVGNDKRPARLRIVTENDGHDIEYLTLSYAWGPATSSPKTTASNVGEMTVSLPKELPRTIHDAIIFTRAMGIRYLWVDALCILQAESPDGEAHRVDWHHEAARFGHYYHNSVVTLAATGSASSDKGLFLPRPGLSLQPKPLVCEGSSPNCKRCIIRTTSPKWDTEIRYSPLAKRGWAKQERILSTRVLHFTTNCVLWECNQKWATEADPSGLYTKMEGGSFSDEDFISGYRTYRSREKWLDFITGYSRTKFTFPSDMLPALSGVASRLQSRTSQKYIAGIWEDRILEGICWMNLAGSTQAFQRIRNLPSWSWASLGEGVDFFRLCNSMLKVQGWELRTDGERTSGHVLEARLRVCGRFRRINLTDLGLQPHPSPDGQKSFFISPRSLQNLGYFPVASLDNMIARDLSLQDHPCLLIGTGGRLVGLGMESEGGILILEAAGRGVDDVEAFRRIGFLRMVVDENWKVAEERLVDLL